ncbi:MAG: hypothetical protein IH624_00020 [Phycisphaerae bacterium]|nr:hypothetical protein [Phycisphaerae bacterium]
MCQRCEICLGEIEQGYCVSCGLPAHDYPLDEDMTEDAMEGQADESAAAD